MELAISIVIVEELLCSMPLLSLYLLPLWIFRGLQFSIENTGNFAFDLKTCRETGEPVTVKFLCVQWKQSFHFSFTILH